MSAKKLPKRKLWIYLNAVYFSQHRNATGKKLFDSVRRARKETKIEAWVWTAISTGSTTS